jgi:GTP-binding protein
MPGAGTPPRLVVIGRPNVGKSTLFNRLLGRRRALVHDLPGVTRDRLEEKAEWWFGKLPYEILLVDTGGLGGERFAEEIDRQVQAALSQADVALMLFDAQSGLTPADEEVLLKLRRAGVDKQMPVLGVVNKVDAEVHEQLMADFFATGLDPILTVSAEHGRGMDDLKDAVREALGDRFQPEIPGELEEELPDEDASEPDASEGVEPELVVDEEGYPELPDEPVRDDEIPRIAIVGRPNVGKSTLTNALLRQERMITSPIAGTTVDSVDSYVDLGGKPFVLIDTAGIRRKSKTEKGVEVLSVVQARKALERCDVAVLVLDGEQGISDQDEKIGGLIDEVGCGLIILMNKWDVHKRNPKFTRDLAADIIRDKMGFLKWAPIMFASALEGKGFQDLGDLAEEILRQRRVKIPTREFTEWVRAESEVHNPGNAKFYMCHQSGRHPPTFVCHVSDPDKVHFSLKRHLVNAMRERWGFMGNPVRLLFVKGKNMRR